MIDQPYMFDFYDGGGLDIASLSFAEVDARGQRQRPRVRGARPRARAASRTSAPGPGGSTSSGRSPRRAWSSTSTARRPGRQEGSLPKFVPEVKQISFNGTLARERGQQVRYVTDRAVFALEDDGLVLDRGRARDRRGARRPGRRWASGRASRTTCGPRTSACTPTGRWAWRPTSRRGPGMSEPRRAPAGPRGAPRARQPAAQPRRRRRCSRSWRRRSRRWRPPTRARCGRSWSRGSGERAFSAGSHVGELREPARSRRPGPARAARSRRSPAWPRSRCRRSPRSRATRSAAGWRSRSPATSASRPSARSSACPRCASR